MINAYRLRESFCDPRTCKDVRINNYREKYENLLPLMRAKVIVPIGEGDFSFEEIPEDTLHNLYTFIKENPNGGVYTNKKMLFLFPVLEETDLLGSSKILNKDIPDQSRKLEGCFESEGGRLFRDLFFEIFDVPFYFFAKNPLLFSMIFPKSSRVKLIKMACKNRDPSSSVEFSVLDLFFRKAVKCCDPDDHPFLNPEIISQILARKIREGNIPTDILILATLLLLSRSLHLLELPEGFDPYADKLSLEQIDILEKFLLGPRKQLGNCLQYLSDRNYLPKEFLPLKKKFGYRKNLEDPSFLKMQGDNIKSFKCFLVKFIEKHKERRRLYSLFDFSRTFQGKVREILEVFSKE